MKLTQEQCEHAKYLYKHTSCSMNRVAAHFGVSPITIAKVLDGTYKPKKQTK